MMQAKLLRVIQEREIQRVGSDDTVKVDVRILAATNRNLEDDVAEGKFREDLYYRLNVVTVDVPPLRDRQDDIALLVQHFLEKYSQKNRKQVKGFSPTAMDITMNAQVCAKTDIDTFLLCSDGLYDMVPDKEIRDILLNNPALNDKSNRLVARALKRGGKDNVTVMVIQV